MVDTNVVVSALVFQAGHLSWLRLAFATGTVIPVVSAATVDELLRVLAYPKFELDEHDINELLADYLPFAEVWSEDVPYSGVKVPDSSDVMFVDLATAANVDVLVSGDRHLTGLGPVSHVKIVTPAELRTLVETH